MNKKINKIILILILILISLIITIIHNHNTKQNCIKNNQIRQTLVKANEIDNYNYKIEKLKIKLQETNELLVLEGTTDISCTYDNSNVLNTKDDSLSFLHRKFNELKIREIKVETEYNFGFSYNLNNINIEKDNESNRVKIVLSDHNLNLKYIEENKDKTVLTDSIHILASKFTPQEVNEVMNITKVKTLNTIQNKGDVRKEAMNNTKKNIELFAKELGVDVKVEIQMQGLVENNDAEIGEVKIKG